MVIEPEPSFVDANILVYATQGDSPHQTACMRLLELGPGAGLYVSSQVLAEFYSVVTNPRRVREPFSPAEAADFVKAVLARVELLPIGTEAILRWVALAENAGVTGPDVFDLQIAATMLGHGISRIYTFNTADYRGIEGIVPVQPEN